MIRVLVGHVLDRLAELPPASVHCVVTSPPYYGLRDYGIEPQVWESRYPNSEPAWEGSLGLEPTPALYIEHMVAVFREVRRVLRKDGTLWLNIGDSYASNSATGKLSGESFRGSATPTLNSDQQCRVAYRGNGIKPKDLLGIPWALAFALRDDGWWLRSEITWAKRAPMPESCTDRPSSATEKVFLLTKSKSYFYDAEAAKEDAEQGERFHGNYEPHGGIAARNGRENPGTVSKRNMRNWWLLGPEPFPEAHFATFPTEVPRRAILAGTSWRGVCPKCGAGWERVIESNSSANARNERIDDYDVPGLAKGTSADRARRLDGKNYEHVRRATGGWHPTCSCDAGAAVPATVLDPFFGAGTTGLVADRLGRHCIGIELNPKYAAMAERRCREEVPLFAEIAAE